MPPVELLTATVAVICDPGPPPETDLVEAFRTLIRVPLNVSQTVDGSLIVASNRDQMEVSLSPNKVDVREVSGDAERAAEKIPRVLDGVFRMLSSPQTRSYGINFILESDLSGAEGATAWLGQTFLNESLSGKLDTTLSSDSVMLSFHQGSKVHTIRLQITDGTRVVVNSNASEAIASLPNEEKLKEELTSQYGFLMDVLRKVGFK
jgi:hypothetical protein